MLKPIRFVPRNTKIPFVPWRRYAFTFSGLLVLGSILAFLTMGLNFGIDFRGGILIEVRTPQAADIPAMRQQLGSLGLGDVSIQEFGAPNDVLVRIQRQQGDEKAQLAAADQMKQALGEGMQYRRVEFVGPTVGAELIQAGILAVGLALLSILVYIWLRFEWQFGICALVALMHDVISTIGLFAVISHEFNLSTVAAVLTIAGYSINDTVVVFDRIRENLRKYKKMPLPELLNQTINETLSRTTMTSFTTLLSVLAIYFFGGPVLADFALAMIWGILIGTYSSIFVGTPLLLYVSIGRGDEDAAPMPVPQNERSPG
jgi:preprotein translocase subunit SecF